VTKVSGMVMAWLLLTFTAAVCVATVAAWARGESPPGSGLGSILRNFVGGLTAEVGVAETRGRGTTVTGVIMVCEATGDTRLGSMTGRLVPGSPGSLFCSSSLSLSLS